MTAMSSISPIPLPPPSLRVPGVFITGTDTGVGKTAAACAIAATLRRQLRGARVGVCKPFATGCRRDREGLVSPDAEALAHYADCRLPLDTICPIRYAPPLAPAAAAEGAGHSPDWDALALAVRRLDEASDVLVIEGIGGAMVPLAMPPNPSRRARPLTVLDLMAWLGLPALVVCRSGLGTLNHTALSVAAIESAGVRVAGLLMNGYEIDAAANEADPSLSSNRLWLERLTGVKVLAALPRVAEENVRPDRGVLDDALLEAAGNVWWEDVLGQPVNP